MKTWLVLIALIMSSVALADPTADVGSIFANERGCFRDNPIGRRDFSARQAQEVDRAIPCANIVVDGIDGQRGAGSLNDFNAGMHTRHVLYAELVRQQKAELDCKASSLAGLASVESPGHNEVTASALNSFAAIRSDIVRLKNEAAAKLDEGLKASQTAAMSGDGSGAASAAALYMAGRESEKITEKLRKLLTKVPFGSEPEVQAALTRLSVAMPANLKSDEAIRLFEAAYSNALASASKKYTNARTTLDGLLIPEVKGRDGKPIGGDLREDDNLWRAFGAAESFENFAAGLRVNMDLRKQIACSLDARYRRGPEIMKTADLVINGSGLVAAVATAVFPPAAVVTAPVIAFASVYQAAGAVYFINEAVKECSSPSTRYTIVTGQQCLSGNALAAKEIKQSENSTCAGNIGNAALAGGGIALEALAVARSSRILSAAASEERAVLSAERATVSGERAAASSERAVATSSERQADEIVVTGRRAGAGSRVKPPGLDETARIDAEDSLRAKGITEENLTTFFNKDAPINLTNNERVFLFEKYANFKLSAEDANELLRLHRIGPGYGNYSLAQLRQKAEGIKALLAKNGITDPDEVSRILNLTLRNGVAGQVRETAEQRTLLQKVLDFLGKGPRAAQASVDRRFAAEIERAPQAYRETKREVLDTERASSRYGLARRISGSDTFGGQGAYRGTFDDLMTSGAYADDARYEALGGRRLWWEDATMSGRESRSPVDQITGNAGDVERRVFWQKDQLDAMQSASGKAEYNTNFTRMGIAENRVNGELHSVEGIARRPDGSIEFFYYVKDGGKLKPALTFKGEPIPQACIKCHQHPSRPGVATQVPYMIFQKTGLQGAARGYESSLANLIRDEKLPAVVPDRLGRPGTVAPKIREAPAANRAQLRDDSQRMKAERTAARVGVDRDAQLREVERVTGRAFGGREGLKFKQAVGNASEMRFKRAGRTPAQVQAEQYSYLRYNMTRNEVAAYRRTNGTTPPEVFTADQADRIMREGVFGAVPRPAAPVAPKEPVVPKEPAVRLQPQVAQRAPAPARVPEPAVAPVQAASTQLASSNRFRFVTMGKGESRISATTLTPGRSYTTLEHDGKIVIGESFVGPSGTTSNSHITLTNAIKHDMTVIGDKPPYRGGAIRVNGDGSVDVSGYHMGGFNREACQKAADTIAEALRASGVRVRVSTPDRLPQPGT